MTSVLFVCTGNVFRSLTAEYSLRRQLGGKTNISVSSAGTMHAPDLMVRDDVASYLSAKGFDVSGHQRRTLSDSLIRKADLVVAMSIEHKTALLDTFATDALLFTEACGGKAEPLHDVDDLFAPEDFHCLEAQKHIYKIIDQIVDLTPLLTDRLVSGWKGVS